MKTKFPRIKIGVLNQHFDQLGGGTTHSFKILEFLKRYYDIDVFLPNNAKDTTWMKTMLNLDTDGINFYPYTKGVGMKYSYMFLNISHWKAEETNAFKKFMLVFFPQFFFPLYDYHLMANSEYTKKNIVKRWSVDPSNIDVIYPPVQTSQFKSTIKENMILHVSRLARPRPEADKGHLQMIQAFKEMKLKDWSLHFVGQPQDFDYVKTLKNQAAGYNIFFHEKIPFKRLQELYGKSKIYWHMTGISMPSEAGAQEHFGMSIVEAMASRNVPISFNSGGPKEIIEDGKSGFLVDDIQGLVKQTKTLIEDESKLKKMAEKAELRAMKFDEENVKKTLYSLMMQTDKVSIIMVCHNNSKLTKECIDRLYEVTPEGFELILIDNASTDNTPQLIEEIAITRENVKFIHTKTNLGFAEANNLGLKEASGEYICYLNNDTLPQWGWMEHMIDVLEENPEAGIVGSRLYFPELKDGSWHIQHAGVEFGPGMTPKHIGRQKNDDVVPHLGIQEVEAVTGACLMVRKKLAKFNERFERGYYEDTDMCLTARDKGYKVFINHDSRLIHYEGKTQDILKKQDMAKFKTISKKNLELFNKIWKPKFDSLPKIEQKVNLIREGKKITGVEIGGGENPMYPEYEQVDLRPVGNVEHINDARNLSFPTNSVKHICACYMLQCLTKSAAEEAVKEWHRVLVPGGKVEIYISDIKNAASRFAVTEDDKWLKEIYGDQKHELDYYKHAWTLKTLDMLLSSVNFVRLIPGGKPKHRPNAISVIAYKSKEV